jgi:AcrR family transcriptional regulator
VIDAALALAGRQGWRRTGLAEIALEAGLRLDEVYAVCPSKPAVLGAIIARIDRTMLKTVEAASDEGPRDRLFDLIMRRFDVLLPRRQAFRILLRDSFGDPESLLTLPAWHGSMVWVLEAAGIPTAGWRGRLRIHVLAGVYLLVLRTFFDDDSADLTRTMAVLDRRLRGCERLLGLAAAPLRDAPITKG